MAAFSLQRIALQEDMNTYREAKIISLDDLEDDEEVIAAFFAVEDSENEEAPSANRDVSKRPFHSKLHRIAPSSVISAERMNSQARVIQTDTTGQEDIAITTANTGRRGILIINKNGSGKRIPPVLTWENALTKSYKKSVLDGVTILHEGDDQCSCCQKLDKANWTAKAGSRDLVGCFSTLDRDVRCLQCLLRTDKCSFSSNGSTSLTAVMNKLKVEETKSESLSKRLEILEADHKALKSACGGSNVIPSDRKRPRI